MSDDFYKIPQQIRYKDQVLAGMTVRQAFIIGIFGLPAYTIFRMHLPLVLRLVFVVPIMAAGLAVAFYDYRGRPLEVWGFNMLTYYLGRKLFKPGKHVSAIRLSSLSNIFSRGSDQVPGPILSQVPVKCIERDLIKTVNGHVLVLQTGSINYRLKSDDDKKKIWSSYRGLLNLLSLGFPMQFLIRTRRQSIDEIQAHYEEVLKRQKGTRLEALARAERDFVLSTIKDKSVVTRNFYVVIPYDPSFSSDADPTANVFKKAFSREKKASAETSVEIAVKQLATRRDQVINQLKKLGIEAHQLNNSELFELLYDSFNPSLAGGGYVRHNLQDFYPHMGEDDLVDFVAPSYMKVEPDYVDLSGVYMRTVFALDYPGTVYSGWLQPLVDLDQDGDLSIHISPIDSNSVSKVLKRNLSKLLSTKSYRKHKGRMDDFEVEAKHDDAVYLLQKLVRSETKMFNFGLYSTVRAYDLDELDDRTTALKATFESVQIRPEVAKYQMASAVATNLPVAQDRLCFLRNMDSDSAASAMPLSSSDLSSSGGILYGVNPDNSSLVMLDRFSQMNANSIVLGASGSGKSFFIKTESLRYLMEGVSIIIIDPEREYRSVCEAVGGQYITISRNPSEHINPFDPCMDAEGVRGIDRQVGDAQVLIKLMAPDLNMPKAQLEDILYAMFREKEAPLIEDLHRIAQEKGHDELAQAVYQWHRGSLKNIFSHPTDVKLDADYIVFDISEMDEDLRPVAMQVILSWLWRQIFANPRPRIIYVDEAWCLLSTAASWFSAAYRRARKHWAGFTITEHQVETLLESDVMKSILVNSATKLLFAQEPSALKALTEAFDLTDMEQTAIISADQGSGLLYTGNNHVSLKVVAPEEFHRFLSTTPSELYGAVAND